MKRTLKSIRIDLGLKQSELAKKINISYATYQKKENGESPLLARELKRISELSGIPMTDIEIPK